MCGLIGSTKHQITRNTLSSLSHRGPDSRGLRHSPDCQLGHTRLSILGLSGGAQPMSADNGRITISFNGEIYNYLELKEVLREEGVELQTGSDTEVLLNYYIVFGLDKTLEDANGMFAFALYNWANNTLTLARDRVGIKPLFYAAEKDGITFCSEIGPIKEVLGTDKLSIDPVAVSMFFNTFYIASPNTIWNEIRSLEPGHYIDYSLQTKELKVKKYWSLSPQKRENRNLKEFEDLLRDSVRLRMRSDVPFGAYLSGGIDSSLIVKYMSSIDEQCSTYTAEIKDKDLNEKKYADRVAEKYKTNHTNIEVEYGEIKLSFLRKMARTFGQPFADSSIIPTYLISKKISESVAVALGGDGSDENFCGYNKYDYTDKPIQDRFFRNQDLSFLNDKYVKDTYDYMVSKLPYQTEDPQELMRLMDIRFFLEGDILQKSRPDIIFVFGSSLLKENIFSIPKIGCINIHTGLVQYYRGVDSSFWALYDERPDRIGATVHFIDKSIDAGEIIFQGTPKTLSKTDDLDDVFLKNCICGFNMVCENLKTLMAGNIKTRCLAKRGKLYQIKDKTPQKIAEVEAKLGRVLGDYHG